MSIKGRIFWQGSGWYASRIEGDSGMEVIMPLETAGGDRRWPSQSGELEARQKGLGTPFWLSEKPATIEIGGIENLVKDGHS